MIEDSSSEDYEYFKKVFAQLYKMAYEDGYGRAMIKIGKVKR